MENSNIDNPFGTVPAQPNPAPTSPTEPEKSAENNNYQVYKPPKNDKKIIVILVAVLAVIILGVAIALIVLNNNSGNGSNGGTSGTSGSSSTSSSLVPTLATEDIELAPESFDYEIDLSTLDGLTVYEYEKDFNNFLDAYQAGALPAVYVTDFLFDGVDAVKSYDLDDFVAWKAGAAEEPELSLVGGTVVNINTAGNIKLSGNLKKGMLAVNTNGKSGKLNLYLNGVTIDTTKKKWPAVYIYNSDINYSDLAVTISPMKDTENYITGGKFKKVSLMASDNLSSTSYNITYSYEDDDDKTVKTSVTYSDLADYYGVYTQEQLGDNYANILFARVEASSEGLRDGDPTIFYKGSGAISSDIDIDFEGEGKLTVVSYNKEGIEGKSDISFSRGIGEYYIDAQDDCINTTTSKDSSAYSTYSSLLYINVNKLTAIVNAEGDEGDAIDSNGSLVIAGGTVIAQAHPSSPDFGLDSASNRENGNGQYGTYVTGGTVFATGSMFEGLSSNDQAYVTLRNGKAGNVKVKDGDGNVVFEFTSDRSFQSALFSSPDVSSSKSYTLSVE